MKKLFNLMAYAAIIIMSVCVSVSLSSCSEDYSGLPSKNTTTVIRDTVVVRDTIPTPPPTPTDSTTEETTDWHWSVVGDKTLFFYTDTEVVEAMNIGQLTRLFNDEPETKLDSATLSYKLGLALSAPTRIVTSNKNLTVLMTASSNPNLRYGEFTISGKDSIQSVSTDHSFPTSYYTISATTTSKRGYSLHAGHWEAYKYITEKAQWSKVWSDDLYEVEVNDSIFNRETVHNEMNFVIRGKDQSWTISREKIVIVDHFLRMKEKNEDPKEEPEHNHPSWWGEPIKIIGQGTFVYKPGVGANGQGQFFKNINILFENVLVCVTTKSYVKENYSPMDFDWDNALVYSLGSTLRGKTITSKNVTDLNSVIWRDGKWEAALCNYDQKNFSWTYMSPDAFDTVVTEHLAETCGLKNFAGKHTARLHPSLFYTASISNGTLVIKDDNGATIKSFH